MENYNVKETKYPAQSRSKRRRELGQASTGGTASVVVVGGGGETPIIPPHDQLAGITSTSDQYPDTARGIHLTAADADKLKTLLTAILNVISSTDTETVAGDTNVFTALRTLIEIADRAISKTTDDTAAGMIGFDKGIKSTNFDPLSPLGPGMSLKAVMDDNGNPTGFWELIIDYLTVNAKATFKEVVIEQILHVGGAFLFSRASMECIKMDAILETDGITVKAYRCYMDENKINRWDVGCMALCQQFILPTTRRYWRAVIAVGDHWIDLSPTVCEFGSDIPMEKDAIIQFGHLTDAASRSAILLTSYGEDGPSITFYKNIGAVFAGETHPFNLTGRAKTHLGATKSRFVGELVVEGEDGEEHLVPADRGAWIAGTYNYYNRVSHNGSLWLCIADPSTTLEPTDANSSDWLKQVDKGGDGDPGANAITMSLSNSEHAIPTDTDGNNGNYAGAVCQAFVYDGLVDDSANWSLVITKSASVAGSISGKTYTITGLSEDTGYVDFTVSKTGYPSIVKRMTIHKSKKGETGVTPTAYWLLTPPSIARNAAGAYTPATFSVYGYASTSNTPSLYAGKFTISETEDGLNYTVKYASAANESGKTYTPSTATVKAFMVQLRKSVTDSTILDEQIIPVVKDGGAGTPGADGINYSLSANANIITKVIAMGTTTYTPSTLSFYPRKRVGGATPVAPADCNMKIQGFNGTSWVDLQTIASVTSLTYNQAVSATYSQYRAQLYLSTLLVQENVIYMVEDVKSAKDALSYLIGGFDSYNDHVTYASTYGKILMAGGYLNANLIDVDALVANALLVQKMANIAGTYFQTDGVTFTQKNGITLPANINSIDTSLDVNPQSLPDIAAFLTSSALTGTTNLPLVNTVIQDRGTVVSPTTKATNGYMTIPSGVTSIKSNTVAISGDIQIDGRDAGDRAGFVYKCDLFALFYNGTTFISQVVIGQYSMDSNSDYRGISNTYASVLMAVPTGANRVYLYSEHSLYVKTNIGSAPYGNLSINAVAASAYFYNATGIYKSRISPDGYAIARGSDDYFHIKAGATKMALNYKGDVVSNSIQQKLISCVFEANGTPRAAGGYGTLSSFGMNRVSTGIYRIVHNMNTSLGLNTNNYIIQATSEVGLVLCYIWPVNSNEFQIRCFNTSGVAADTVLHVSVTRI